MVNTEEFTKRLHRVMEYYDLSAAAFADKIEVGRSSISHLLSGRNKPSLDFVLKIVQAFPEVELYWLLNGKGSFPKKESAPTTASASAPVSPVVKTSAPLSRDLFAEDENPKPQDTVAPQTGKREIKKIVIFYTDGSFDAFEN